jgi:2-polyprenyl-3-methyl-5-hydroxy-6-metoxy-1,4-benzoquinol methylase
MKIKQPEQRLQSLWGQIDRQHNAQIAPGSRILDVGCGYGSLVHYLNTQGYQAQGVDLDPDSVEVAQRFFPDDPITLASAESLLPTQAGYFDAIVLKDAFHHLLGEHDALQIFGALYQLLQPQGRVVILDPNPMWLLKILRRIARHQDEEATPGQAQEVLATTGFTVKGYHYYEVCGLALSGGYVGLRLVPNWGWLNGSVASLNHGLSWMVARAGLGPTLCWRYLIYADKSS